MNKRKICVVTGSRAEYGLLYWIMKEIVDDDELELQLIVTGMHLSPEFGLTYKVIEDDGFYINEKIDVLLSSDSAASVAKSVALGVIGFADALTRLKPDIVVVLGDRFEIFAVAQACMFLKIPLAHIHGGEVTEGAIDDSIRHSITKMAHLHFVANEEYFQRVIQLGENPDNVFNFGAPGLDNIKKLPLLNKEQLEKELNFEFGSKTFLVTFHPVTLEGDSIYQLNELLGALEQYKDAHIIFTKSNADAGGREINKILESFVDKSDRAWIYTSLGQLRYLSLLKYVDVVVGNSSSGLIEAPMFKVPTVNIGSRQDGRLKAISVIDCKPSKEDILNALHLALSSDFQQKLKYTKSLYGDGNASYLIKEKLKTISLDNLLKKKFFDLKTK